MLAKGKSSGNICISNSMQFLPSDLSANVQKPENVVNRPIDRQTDGQTDGKKEWQGGTIAGGYCSGPLNLVQEENVIRNENSKMSKKITSFSDAVTLTFDLEKLIRS